MAVMLGYEERRTVLHSAGSALKLAIVVVLAICPWWISLPLALVAAIIVRLPFFKALLQSLFLLALAALIWIENGYQSSLSFCAVILNGLVLARCTAPEDLAASLRPVLGRSFALAISFTLAMLPMVMDTLEESKLAWLSRGQRFLGQDFLLDVMERLLNKADEYSMAYEARFGA
ncbi:MAG: hypothetical protein PHI83_08410 [Sphaerochaetaceae bacterium]|jgi:energy-coupling factor transporter transmembrane protein EcfT|nr:hypothetical protein [Sphaerochaetaceae bacterium]